VRRATPAAPAFNTAKPPGVNRDRDEIKIEALIYIKDRLTGRVQPVLPCNRSSGRQITKEFLRQRALLARGDKSISFARPSLDGIN
jgi:hypothetical protein